ncbi:MAG: DUF2551 domain-containing protein [Methanomicrobiales archaeon]|jgi:hypothetical protein|nr:DUF2551 domain-containing protein [Methanomicrobiales archaeon]
MRTPGEIAAVIESRLRRYLARDRTGIRREMLLLFARMRSLTIAEAFEVLRLRFSISYHSVAAMIGLIASRIGILHINKGIEGEANRYEIKSQYVDLLTRTLGPI